MDQHAQSKTIGIEKSSNLPPLKEPEHHSSPLFRQIPFIRLTLRNVELQYASSEVSPRKNDLLEVKNEKAQTRCKICLMSEAASGQNIKKKR